MFRAKFRDGLKRLYNDQALAFHGKLAPVHDPRAFRRLLAAALRQKWVVYAKRPFAGPRHVLACLSGYTHRVAIAHSRLLALDREQGTVSFAYKDYAEGARRKTMTLSLHEFLRRFSLHILPPRFVKIRHYGLLGNHQRKEKIARARRLIIQTGCDCCDSAPSNATPAESPPPPACPHCGSYNLVLIEHRHPPDNS